MQPLDYNRDNIDQWRSIGLGIFGLADMFVALGVRYGSQEANDVIEDIMYRVLETSLETSCDLAKWHGTFKNYDWEKMKLSPLIKMWEGCGLYDKIKEHGLHNGTLLSIAPAGTISTMCGISNGCEPLFKVSYERTTHSLEKQGKYFKVYAKSVEDLLKYHGIDPDSITVEQIKAKFPFVVDSEDIAPSERVQTQVVLQQYVDNAISSTVNLKETATVQDIYDTYMAAWKGECKGITVFRTGCKRGSILGKSSERSEDEDEGLDTIKPKKRRNIKKLNGVTIQKASSCANPMYITINSKGKDIFEVFTNASGGCKSNISTITRLASLALRSGIKVETVVEELRENQCPACQVLRQQGRDDISLSCGAAIGDCIEEAYKELRKDTTPKTKAKNNLLKCPECHKHTLRPEGKCYTCSNCGYSKCD